jgi:hypothetical protein
MAKIWRGRRPGCDSDLMARTVRTGPPVSAPERPAPPPPAEPAPERRELSSSTLPLGTEAWASGTGRVLVTFPGGCVRLDYQEDVLGRAELALPELLDAVRLVPRWRLNAYVLQLTEDWEPHL